MRHPVIFILIFSIIQCLSAEETVVRNVSFEQENEVIKIHYDLIGKADKNYNVKLFLTLADDSSSRYKPQAISGDIAKVKPGSDKEIIWAFKREFPEGLETDELAFTITANKVNSRIYYYLLGGGAALLGGIAFIATQSDATTTEAKGTLTIDVPGEM
jgi:hypothetical protein